MEVIDRQQALLSNYEVFLVLSEEDERQKDVKTKRRVRYPENVTTLMFEGLQYLNDTACTTQSAEQIKDLKEALAEYELTKGEILQIINIRPTQPVELSFIIEECGDRFEVADLEEMCEIVCEKLPRADEGDETEGVDGEGEQDQEENGADEDSEMHD
ncbi:hypothetical protein LPJ53_004091 [Coemansia erecta]|uniref:DNA-directed RNA polymerase III subunit RPC9 n=1 Tax=Coemansia erecta TaxID=147472 RepID=A0A9W7XZV5_9FUNG|nr:hypothetical protein LPJ53_004091 [Coemansia erecta]